MKLVMSQEKSEGKRVCRELVTSLLFGKTVVASDRGILLEALPILEWFPGSFFRLDEDRSIAIFFEIDCFASLV